MRVIEIASEDGIARLRQTWRRLYDLSSDATPFQSWEWNEAWWRHFGARKKLRLLVFYASSSDASLCGIAPLYVARHLGTPLRRLAWLGTGQSDYLGPLSLPEHREAVAAALLRHICSGLRGWDMADLQELAHDSCLVAQLPEVPNQPGDGRSVLAMQSLPFATLPEQWEAYIRSLGKRMRSNLGYYDRLVTRTWPTARYSVASGAEVETGMSALFELHQKRWNSKWLPGALGGRRIQAFHREVAARFDRCGWLRLHLLQLDGIAQAALYCFADKGRTFYYLGGFSPGLAKYSLGTLLTGRAIRRAIEEHCVEFDFLRGEEDYKKRWATEARKNWRILLLRPREGIGAIPGRAGLALNRVERYVTLRARTLAERQAARGRSSGRNATADSEAATQAGIGV